MPQNLVNALVKADKVNIRHNSDFIYMSYLGFQEVDQWNGKGIIQIYSGITCGTVLNGELYTQKLQKLIYRIY